MTYGPPGGWVAPEQPAQPNQPNYPGQPVQPQPPAPAPQWPAPAAGPAQWTSSREVEAPATVVRPSLQQQGYPPAAQGFPPQAPQGFPPPYQPGFPTPGLAPSQGPGQIASIGQRIGAFFIDAVAIAIPFFIATVVIISTFFDEARDCVDEATGSRDPNGVLITAKTCKGALDGLNSLSLVLSVLGLLVVLYYTIMVGRFGATLGKKAVGIKVVDATSGAKIGLLRGFVRYVVQSLANIVCLAGLWSPMIDRSGRRQGWHDKAANDVVVSSRR